MSISKATDLDIASALELTMSDEQEAKFLALRALHAKKIKALMVTIEAKEKEVAKMKVMSKDSRRTQMIQALRGKIKDMEVIQDTIKEEFANRTDKSIEEINEFVIKKTCGGPKRFRPLSREEMENKIIKYEKKIDYFMKNGGGAIDGGKSIASQAKSIASTRDALTNIANRQETTAANTNTTSSSSRGVKRSETENNKNGSSDSLSKVAQYMEEINGLRNALDVTQGALDLQKEEVVRLRQRNSDMAGDDEEVNFLKMSAKEAIIGRKRAEEELMTTTKRLAAAEEEIALMKSGSSLELEQSAMQLDALQSHCEKLLKQNSSLLHRLADMETELDAAHEHSQGAAANAKAIESAGDATKTVIKDLEKKVTRYAEKLKMSESLITELQADNGQIGSLREQLRAKNIAIKELTKHVEQLGGSTSMSNSNSPTRDSNSPLRGTTLTDVSNDNENSRMAELKEENTRLKQALQVAVSNNASPGGAGGLNLSSDSVDMMKMKLQSSNDEVDNLNRQVSQLKNALQASSQSPKRNNGSPRSGSGGSPRKSDVSPRK